MKKIAKRLLLSVFLAYDRIALALSTTIVGLFGAVASILGLPNLQTRRWFLILSSVSFAVGLYIFLVPIRRALQMSYADFWPTTKGARRWMKACLAGNYFQKCGVRTITIIGVACTDIVDLFEDIVEAVMSGMSFRVLMVNPDHEDVGPNGIIKRLETRQQVSTKVQKPIGQRLDRLASIYEKRGKHDVAQKMSNLKHRLQSKDYAEHAECIRVCHALWELALVEAQQRDPNTDGNITVYFMDELPFAKQWVCGDKVVIYSLYVGYPGVGIDNPTFCYSALDSAHPHGEIGQRAAYYVDQLIKKVQVTK